MDFCSIDVKGWGFLGRLGLVGFGVVFFIFCVGRCRELFIDVVGGFFFLGVVGFRFGIRGRVFRFFRGVWRLN